MDEIKRRYEEVTQEGIERLHESELITLLGVTGTFLAGDAFGDSAYFVGVALTGAALYFLES